MIVWGFWNLNSFDTHPCILGNLRVSWMPEFYSLFLKHLLPLSKHSLEKLMFLLFLATLGIGRYSELILVTQNLNIWFLSSLPFPYFFLPLNYCCLELSSYNMKLLGKLKPNHTVTVIFFSIAIVSFSLFTHNDSMNHIFRIFCLTNEILKVLNKHHLLNAFFSSKLPEWGLCLVHSPTYCDLLNLYV